MAQILPFRAWRYNDSLAQNIGELTSPLFDVASEKQKTALYGNPYNSIHVSIPCGECPSESASYILQKWKEEGCVQRDPAPAIYVYYQYFRLPGDPSQYCRKGFICKISIYDWEQNVILRHENTMPESVDDQVELLAATRLNASPTHGLYTDETFELEKFMDHGMQNPLCETEDHQGTRDVLGIIRDPEVIERFVNIMKDKRVILADGHHRYAGSLAYMKRQMSANPDHTGNEDYNYHLMWLTNTEAGDLKILPTHRLIKELDYFIIQEILGLKGKEQSRSACIEYERSFTACFAKALNGEVQLAIITNEISISDVKTVCHSGYTLPQKSTYFWPKAICGFVFSSI